jgi:hypothetical protein
VAILYWSGTIGPSVSTRYSPGPRTPPLSPANSQVATIATVIAPMDQRTAMLVRAADDRPSPAPDRTLRPTIRPRKNATTRGRR